MERTPLLASFCVLLVCAAAAHAGAAAGSPAAAGSAAPAPVPPPKASAEIQRILEAMDHASTWGHPDLFGQFAGMRRLFKGKYKGALRYFKYAARYADKPSQMSLGLMYLNGRGVPKDPATACAWLTLAAERGVPQQYVMVRDRVCAALPSAGHDRAMATLDRLRPEYADDAAKPRMKLALRDARASVTGSHVGHDFNLKVQPRYGTTYLCNGPALYIGGVSVPREGCYTYDPELWDAEKYFAARDRQPFGTVTVGPLRQVYPPSSRTDEKPPAER